MSFSGVRRLAIGLACASALGFATSAAAQSYDGDWAGILKVPGGPELHLVLHVKTAAGKSEAVLDSPDQGASIPASGVKVEGGKLDVMFADIGGELKGGFSSDGKAIDAVWSQGMDMPLTLAKVAAAKP